MKYYALFAGIWKQRANLSWPFRKPVCTEPRELVEELEVVMKQEWEGLVVSHGKVIGKGGKRAFREGTYRYLKECAEGGGGGESEKWALLWRLLLWWDWG